MKLLYIHDTPVDSEEANVIQVVQMCNAFANNGLEVKLAIPQSRNGNNTSYYSDIINSIVGNETLFSIIPYPKITLCGKLKYMGGYFGVKKLLRQTSADICFLRNVSFIELALKAHLPVIYESHNDLIHFSSKILNYLWTSHIRKKSKENGFIKFIAISNELATFWENMGIPPEKIVALHDGFNAHHFKMVKSRSIARQEIGLHDKRKIVLYAGSLYRDRGIEVILKLAELFKECLFIVVGGPEKEKNNLEIMARQKGITNLIFKGRIPHAKVPDYLFAADVLLMLRTVKNVTSNYCSPLKMFEYMASERIIVGQGFPTIKEVLEDRKTALLTDLESFEQLRDKLKFALENSEVQCIAKQARNLALHKYSWDQRAKIITNHVNRALSSS